MIPRLSEYIKELLEFVRECMDKVDIPDYFGFVGEIFKFYEDSLDR